MAGVPYDELIDFRSPEKKCTNMSPHFTPLVPIPVVNISSCTSSLDFVNYGNNPFDQLIEQSNIYFEAKNDPFEMVCKTAFHSDTREKCVFSPDKFQMKEYNDENFLNTSVNLGRCVKEPVPDICASAMNFGKQVPSNFEICDKSNVDLISSTHRIIDLESEKIPNDCNAENVKGTLNLGKLSNSSTIFGKLLDLPSPEFNQTKNIVEIDTKDLCNKMDISCLEERKSNFEINNECIYIKKSLNRSFSSAEEQILRLTDSINTEKIVKDIVAERVEKCIQKALDDSRCYRTNSTTDLHSSYSPRKVKLHRRSYSSSSVRDAEFISWLGLEKSRIKHRKSDFNIDVEISKFNNQCISDFRNLRFKKSFTALDRLDSYPNHSSNIGVLSIFCDASPIQGNSMQQISSYKSCEVNDTESFPQVEDIDQVCLEANLMSSALKRSTVVEGSCMVLEDDDILTTKAPWELQCAQSVSSEDCDEVETKHSEDTHSVKSTFLHSTPLPNVKGNCSSKTEKKILPPYISLTPMERKQNVKPVRLFPHSEDTKKGPLRAVIPIVKMTKLQNMKGPLPATTKADKPSPNSDMVPKRTPSPNSISESVRIKHVEKSAQNGSLGTDAKQRFSLRRIVSHGNNIGSPGLKKAIQESFHERSRSVDVKVEAKQAKKDHRPPRRVQSASNMPTVKKEMKSPILKTLIRNSKISPNLQKALPRLSNTTDSKSGKENITP